MQYKADSPDDYISQLPEDRQGPIKKLNNLIKKNMPKGLEAGMGYGMLAYYVPKSIYPPGYHCKPFPPLPFINLASQKNFIALYHMGIYASPKLLEWFTNEYPKHVKTKLDMGKSCIRFKNLKTIPYDLIGELCTKMTCDEWINIYSDNIRKK